MFFFPGDTVFGGGIAAHHFATQPQDPVLCGGCPDAPPSIAHSSVLAPTALLSMVCLPVYLLYQMVGTVKAAALPEFPL